jgi:carbamoyltransferase
MAAAVDRRINDWLNQRLERTEFMPFAPVVRKERCG